MASESEFYSSRDRLKEHLEITIGDRYPFSPHSKLEQVEGYIKGTLESYGLPVHRLAFPFHGDTFFNLTAQKPGCESSVFIISAHFDAVEGSPGADDNASGIAVLLECARRLAGETMRHSLESAAFNLEEFGMVGSSHYVRTIKKSAREVVGMISLEMVGYVNPCRGSQKYPSGLARFYPSEGNFIGLVANRKSKKMMDCFSKAMCEVRDLPVETLVVPWNGWLMPPTRLSDHAPFWDAGYPALLITDTSFFRNPHYHSRTDTFQTLNLDFMQQVVEGVTRGVRAVASL